MPSADLRPAAALALLAALATPLPGRAEERIGPEPLMDNSFLLEEAYNQEAGVVQQIATFGRDRATRAWTATLTQEWPVPDQANQLSYTLALASDGAPGGARGLGDLLLNWRYQAVSTDAVAVSPRLSAVVPGGARLGYRGLGLQAALPVSTTISPWLVLHTNLGATWVPEGRAGEARCQWRSYSAGQGLIWLAAPRLNPLVEVLWTSTDQVAGGATTTSSTLTVSPGVRWGLDLAHDLQIVLGLAVPVGLGPSAGDRGIFLYLSVELPFWHPADAGLTAPPPSST